MKWYSIAETFPPQKASSFSPSEDVCLVHSEYQEQSLEVDLRALPSSCAQALPQAL